MKPILIGGDYNTTTQGEFEARFGKKSGGLTVLAPIGSHATTLVVSRLAQARVDRQVALVWLHAPPPFMAAPGWHPNQLPGHPDTMSYIAAITAHCVAGGRAIVGIMGEMEQYAQWGPKVYTTNFDAIASQLPVGAEASWDKGPFVAPPKYGGKLNFADWRPQRAVYRGVHPYGPNVDPNTLQGGDTYRFLHDPATAGMPTTMLEGGFTEGEILNADIAVPWFTALAKMIANPLFDVRVTAAPINSTWGGQMGWDSGRYCAGPHTPPGNLSGPPWAGSPEACAVLDKLFGISGLWLWAGSPMLEAVLKQPIVTGVAPMGQVTLLDP